MENPILTLPTLLTPVQLHHPHSSGEKMKLIGDKAPTPEFKSMTVRWPLNSKIPAIHGKWTRHPDGRIEAVYTAGELACCLMVAALISDQESME
jgi:hypothetical protein